MKAIAVIKKMPKDCDECPFVNENRDCILLNEDAFPNDWMEDAPYYSLKEKGDCPLRPLPQKNDFEYVSDLKLGYRMGWNACLETITGEIKEWGDEEETK